MAQSTTDYTLCAELAQHDVEVLSEKGKSYGDSWKVRGGVGALMMLARKWDRIELAAKREGWDIFKALTEKCARRDVPTEEFDDLLGDIRDLRRYLLLVDAEFCKENAHRIGEAPGSRYTNQDPDVPRSKEDAATAPIMNFDLESDW